MCYVCLTNVYLKWRCVMQQLGRRLEAFKSRHSTVRKVIDSWAELCQVLFYVQLTDYNSVVTQYKFLYQILSFVFYMCKDDYGFCKSITLRDILFYHPILSHKTGEISKCLLNNQNIVWHSSVLYVVQCKICLLKVEDKCLSSNYLIKQARSRSE